MVNTNNTNNGNNDNNANVTFAAGTMLAKFKPNLRRWQFLFTHYAYQYI